MRNKEKNIPNEKKLRRVFLKYFCPGIASTAIFKGVHYFGYVMLLSKMLDEFREMGLIMKAKEQEGEDSEKRKRIDKNDKKSGRELTRLLGAEYSRRIYSERMSPADALEDMVMLLNDQFQEITNHTDKPDYKGITFDEYPIITPAQSEWLIDKYNETKDRMIGPDGKSEFGWTEEDLVDTVDSNSHAYWLGLLPSSITPRPATSVNQLMYQNHPLGSTWHNILEDSMKRGDFKLDTEALSQHRENIWDAKLAERRGLDEASSAFPPQLERNIPDKGSESKPFSQEEMEAQSEAAKSGYEHLYSKVNMEPGNKGLPDDEVASSSLKPIGKYSDLSNNLSQRMTEKAEKHQSDKYDEEHMFAATDARNEMVTRHTQTLKKLESKYNRGKKGPTTRRAELKEEIENFKLEAAGENKQFEDQQKGLRDRLRWESLNEQFHSMRDGLNHHAISALGTKNIGMKGGKKGRAPHIVTPTLKQIATLLNLHCDSVNAPDVMSEPLLSFIDETPRDAQSTSYLRQLTDDAMDRQGRLHPALSNAIRANGALVSRFPDVGHLGHKNEAGSMSRQVNAADKVEYANTVESDDSSDDIDVTEASGAESSEGPASRDGEHNTDAKGLLGSDMGLAPDTSTAAGEKQTRAMVQHIRSGDETAKTPKKIARNWHLYRDEILQKVHRGEITKREAKQILTDKYYNSDDFDEAHNAFLGMGDMDEIEEPSDINHPLHGRTPEERKKYAQEIMSVVFGVRGLLERSSMRFHDKDSESSWHRDESNRPASAGDLKKLFHPPTADDFGDSRVDENEADNAEAEHRAKDFDANSELAHKVNNLGLDWNEVTKQTLKMIEKHARRKQAGSQEPLALSAAFRETMAEITLSATNRVATRELDEDKLHALTQQMKALEQEAREDKQTRLITGETTDEMKQRREQLKELKVELNQQRRIGGKPMMWFANQVVNAIQEQALEKEKDDNWLNKTREQTHNMVKGDMEKKKDCDGCVGSKNHFMNEDKQSSYNNVHEYIKSKRGRSPYTHMRVPVPDIRFLPKDSDTKVSLRTVANAVGLGDDWDASIKHRHEETIKSMLMEKLIEKPHACAELTKKYNLGSRHENRLPVGAAALSSADLALASVMFPDDYRKHQANEQSNDIRNQQRKSITGAMNLFGELQKSGFKSRVNYKTGEALNFSSERKLMEDIWNHSGGRALSDAEIIHNDAKDVVSIAKNKFSSFFNDKKNGRIWAQYSTIRRELNDLSMDEENMSPQMLRQLQKHIEHTNWDNRHNDTEDITMDDAKVKLRGLYEGHIKRISKKLKIPNDLNDWRFGGDTILQPKGAQKGKVIDIKSSKKGNSIGNIMNQKDKDGGPEVLNGIFNTIQGYQSIADEQMKEVEKLSSNLISVDSSALGAMMKMMPSIVRYANEEPESDGVEDENNRAQDFIDYMMKRHYTENDGLPKRTVLHAGQIDANRIVNRGSKAFEPVTYEGTPVVNEVPMGDESLWQLYPGGPSMRHGGDNNLGSIFNHISGLFSRPSIDDLTDAPNIIKRLEEYGFNHEHEGDDESLTTSLQAAAAKFADLFPDAESSRAEQNEDDDGLVSETERRRRNHSDMTVNEDRRDDENKLGTSTLCGYCRGHGSVSKDRLANYYAAHNKDLRLMNATDPEMKQYISQMSRPASTPSFDHHREEHGEDAFEDHEHWSYACPDCEHNDKTVRGGKVSDGLCNHCLGRGEIDPDDKPRMRVLLNETLKHAHRFGDHADIESLLNAGEIHGSKSFVSAVKRLIKGNDPKYIKTERPTKGDEDIGETYDHLTKMFDNFDMKQMLPESMFFEAVQQGEYPNVLSPKEYKNALNAAKHRKREMGQRKSIKTEWEKPSDELQDDIDPTQDAMSKLPKQSVQKVVDGTHMKGMNHYLQHMMSQLDKYGADDEKKAKGQELVDIITQYAKRDSDAISFSLGDTSEHGEETVEHGLGSITPNAAWHQLQNLINNQFKQQISITKQDPRGMEISQLTSDDDEPAKDIFGKNHDFAHQQLIYHKGRMMSRHEIAHYDDLEGMAKHQVTNPHEVEEWFARNSNPKAVNSRRNKWKKDIRGRMNLTIEERLKGDGYYLESGEEEDEKGIYAARQEPIPTQDDKSDIMGAFMRRGGKAQKVHEKTIKRATQFTKRIEKMKQENISPIVRNKNIIPPNTELLKLVNELGITNVSDGGEEAEGNELHPSLIDFKDDAFEWLRPRPPNPEDPDGYREASKNEVPMHLKLESEIEHHLEKEFEQYLQAKALKHFINEVNPDAGPNAYSYPMEDDSMQFLTEDMVKQMNQPAELGGNPKEISKINNSVKELIKKSKRNNTYHIGKESLTRSDYMNERKDDVIEHPDGPQSVEWGDFADNPWDGINKIVDRYYENYDKHPGIERDNQLIDFAHKMYWADKAPNMSIDALCARHGVENEKDWKEKLQDPDFAKEADLVINLNQLQHPSWKMSPPVLSKHIDTLSHIQGLKDSTWQPKPLQPWGPGPPPQEKKTFPGDGTSTPYPVNTKPPMLELQGIKPQITQQQQQMIDNPPAPLVSQQEQQEQNNS